MGFSGALRSPLSPALLLLLPFFLRYCADLSHSQELSPWPRGWQSVQKSLLAPFHLCPCWLTSFLAHLSETESFDVFLTWSSRVTKAVVMKDSVLSPVLHRCWLPGLVFIGNTESLPSPLSRHLSWMDTLTNTTSFEHLSSQLIDWVPGQSWLCSWP